MKIRAPSIIIIALTLAALLSAACGGRNDAGAPPTAPEERIAFVSDRDGNDEIYAMNPDGSSVKRLTNSYARDWQPARSPDGWRVAFVSDRDGNLEIYAVNADGTDLTRLTNNDAHDYQPVWSPDGRRIAFISERNSDRLRLPRNEEIYVMNADGTDATRLTNNPDDDGQPTWSPDARRIAFTSVRDGNWDIYVANADGSGTTRLTHSPSSDLSPAWSPDGRRIAYVSARESVPRYFPANTEIYAMNADGTDITRLTNNKRVAREPAWSPDGRRIAFSSSHGHAHSSIHVMNVDGSNSKITWGIVSGGAPAWSPDGRRIVFTDYPGDGDIIEGDTEIYTISADGSEITQLTDNDYGDYAPSWGPAR